MSLKNKKKGKFKFNKETISFIIGFIGIILALIAISLLLYKIISGF